ncbi:hypothetical protein FB45DRAFT_913804 [Roridomyces roridus]|uniref:Uncharacterized protein n=1 Tax=Roridomyces roridus TaxID=1738132 RepID=A0AAD7BWZ9_9AGAR|nr:hypothetical protein FB45DRAFT_913804 [Roridomyces roridus]
MLYITVDVAMVRHPISTHLLILDPACILLLVILRLSVTLSRSSDFCEVNWTLRAITLCTFVLRLVGYDRRHSQPGTRQKY